ncbi:hypothetical protein [Amycolatopsis sp. NPDC051371]|uniref:hypothetical protein n=1 Tax=Amycolatopsis sp. NPDC051371 TaxID=3155800 RepID=UPI0034415935
MGAHGPTFLATRGHVSDRWRPRLAARNRWLLLALATAAVVPADDGGDVWAMAAVFAVAGASVLAYRALVRAAAKVEAALDDELDTR